MNVSHRVIKFNDRAYSRAWAPTRVSDLRVRRILDLVGSRRRVLDVGCYDGTISRRIAALGNQVVGVDISAPAVALARKKGLTAYVGSVEDSRMFRQLGRFDVVVAGEIIEHIFDTDALLTAIHRLLRPRGELLLTTPNLAGLGARLSLLLGRPPWMIETSLHGPVAGHIRYFTYSTLCDLLARNGFRVTRFVTDSVGLGPSMTLPGLDRLFPALGRIIIVQAVRI